MLPPSPSVAIITMVRWADFPYAWSCLNPLVHLLQESTHHFILVNDSRDPALEDRLGERPFTTLITPGENLGVARGRNRLIEASLAWGADLIVSLDDDLLVPSDLIERTLAQMSALADAGHRVGLVGPAVLDYHESGLHSRAAEERVEAGGLADYLDTESVRSALIAAWDDEIPTDVVYHLGIRHWQDHYMRPSGGRAARLRSVVRSITGTGRSGQVSNGEIRRTEHRSDVLKRDSAPIEVDTVAGGVCAYSADLVRDIGLLEEAFSPFGYEDAEFAIRARRAGYQNFVLPSEILLHDLASRNKARDHGVVLVGLGKARAIIARKQYDDPRLPLWLAEALINGLLQIGFTLASRSGSARVSHSDLLCGCLRYLAGYVAGAYRPLSSVSSEGPHPAWEGQHGPGEVRTSSGRIRFDRVVCRTADFGSQSAGSPPLDLDADIEGLAIGIAGAEPLSGLPTTVKGGLGITYRMDIAARRLELSRLRVDIPGIVTADLEGALVGVGPGDPVPELDPEDVGIEYLQICVRDLGLIGRVESTVAWRQGLVGDGVLPAVGPDAQSPPALAIREWLSGRPGTLRLALRPLDPITIRRLGEIDGTSSWEAEFSPLTSISVHS